MNRTRRSWALLLISILPAALPFALRVRGRTRAPCTIWSDYGESVDSTQYSGLTQINKTCD
jgi:hypothetical protein